MRLNNIKYFFNYIQQKEKNMNDNKHNPNHTPPNEPTGIRTSENHPMDKKKWMAFIPLALIVIVGLSIFGAKSFIANKKETKFNEFLKDARVDAIVDYESFDSDLFSNGFTVKNMTIKASDNQTSTIDMFKVNKYDKEAKIVDAKIQGFHIPTDIKKNLTNNPNIQLPPSINALADQMGNEIVMDLKINATSGKENENGLKDISIHDFDINIHNLFEIRSSAKGVSKTPETLKDLNQNQSGIYSLNIDLYDKGISNLVQALINEDIGQAQAKKQVNDFYNQMEMSFGENRKDWPIMQQMMDQIFQTLVLQNNAGFSLVVKPKPNNTAYYGPSILNGLEVKSIKTQNVEDLDI